MSDHDEGTYAWTDMGWGPEYRWRYRVLADAEVHATLKAYASAEFEPAAAVDSVAFQPCLNDEERSQDRRVVQRWDLDLGRSGGAWVFAAVFDGHAGHETVDHAIAELPALIKQKLRTALCDAGETWPMPESVSAIISDAIVGDDESLFAALSALFPCGVDGISMLSPGEVEDIIKDARDDGENMKIVQRCMCGSTVLLSLVDPSAENLWIVNLGDCQAVLGTRHPGGGWEATLMTSAHNAANEAEAQRIRNEHPNEPECVLRDRVLGALAVTRALGDFAFKLPACITERVFLPLQAYGAPAGEWVGRNVTPPYVGCLPAVRHHKLVRGRDEFLIMCSDGLGGLFGHGGDLDEETVRRWVEVVGPFFVESRGKGAALALLREALGGRDVDKVSRMMMLESTERWMDDTTIIVQKL